jgi:glucose/arabinose dehydrogenase
LQAQTTPPVTVDLVPWATGLQYVTEIAHCGDGRLFAATQGGTIWVISDSMTVLPQPFLNIWYKLWFSGEQGLIGLAFDPDYAENGHFYVNYTQPDSLGHNTIISRFTVTSDPNVADPNSEVVLMSIPQTGYEHKGGDLEFDEAGHLYISIGDGGPQGDPNQHAQNLNSRMGKLLRIDVQDDGSWTVPPDNPFVGAESDTLPEIWAYGLRNPYRIGLDTVADRLWIGDVGGSSYDEVDAVSLDAGGLNFGWRCYEGDAPFLPGDCPSDTGITWPVTTQANILNGGSFCALIGGKVYHGNQYPRLYGRYLYTDYCSGNIRSVRPADGGGWLDESLLPTSAPGSSCIAENHLGELFLANQVTQTVYKITDHCPMPAPVLTRNGRWPAMQQRVQLRLVPKWRVAGGQHRRTTDQPARWPLLGGGGHGRRLPLHHRYHTGVAHGPGGAGVCGRARTAQPRAGPIHRYFPTAAGRPLPTGTTGPVGPPHRPLDGHGPGVRGTPTHRHTGRALCAAHHGRRRSQQHRGGPAGAVSRSLPRLSVPPRSGSGAGSGRSCTRLSADCRDQRASRTPEPIWTPERGLGNRFRFAASRADPALNRT